MDEKELDKMAKDIEPIEEPKEDVKPENPAGFVEDKETYVKPDGETTSTPVRTPTVIKDESSKGKWVFGGLATILILGLGAASAWLYTDAQSIRNELQNTKTGLTAARDDAAKLRGQVTQNSSPVPVKSEDFATFIAEYDKMLEAGVELSETDKKDIEEGVKKYYKLSELPEKWQIVLGYKDAKVDKETGKPVNALVFWPASEEKPAGFFEMTQDKEGKWQYNEQR